MKRWYVLLVLALSVAAGAQTTKKPDPKKAAAQQPAGAPNAALMQKVADAWGTLDLDNVAKYYSKAPENVYYDITPLNYTGWQEYADGVKKVFEDVKSASFALQDPQVHTTGNLAWGTTTWVGVFEHKDGKKEIVNGRWTAIWEKQGGQWLIVHDHFSEPMP